MMAYPEKLDISPFMSQEASDDPFTYKLFGLVVHEGYGLQWGHYKSYVNSFATNNWYCCNDESVTQIPAQNAMTKQAYILFYKKIYTGERKVSVPKEVKQSSPVIDQKRKL